MATSSFDRKLEVLDAESREKLMRFLESDKPVKPITRPLFSATERDRGEKLLARCLSHYKHS